MVRKEAPGGGTRFRHTGNTIRRIPCSRPCSRSQRKETREAFSALSDESVDRIKSHASGQGEGIRDAPRRRKARKASSNEEQKSTGDAKGASMQQRWAPLSFNKNKRWNQLSDPDIAKVIAIEGTEQKARGPRYCRRRDSYARQERNARQVRRYLTVDEGIVVKPAQAGADQARTAKLEGARCLIVHDQGYPGSAATGQSRSIAGPRPPHKDTSLVASTPRPSRLQVLLSAAESKIPRRFRPDTPKVISEAFQTEPNYSAGRLFRRINSILRRRSPPASVRRSSDPRGHISANDPIVGEELVADLAARVPQAVPQIAGSSFMLCARPGGNSIEMESRIQDILCDQVIAASGHSLTRAGAHAVLQETKWDLSAAHSFARLYSTSTRGSEGKAHESVGHAEDLRECPLCLQDQLHSSQGYEIPGCGHWFCEACFAAYWKHRISPDLLTPHLPPSLMRCPIWPGCRYLIDPLLTQAAKDEKNSLWGAFPPSSARLLDYNLQLEDYVKDMREEYGVLGSSPIPCCTCPGCSSFLLLPAGEVRSNSNGAPCTVTCRCSMAVCLGCGDRGHFPATCAEMSKWSDINSVVSSLSNVKQCPRCRQGIYRWTGCSHMRCLCGYSFCWDCGGSLSSHDRQACRTQQASFQARCSATLRMEFLGARSVPRSQSKLSMGRLAARIAELESRIILATSSFNNSPPAAQALGSDYAANETRRQQINMLCALLRGACVFQQLFLTLAMHASSSHLQEVETIAIYIETIIKAMKEEPCTSITDRAPHLQRVVTKVACTLDSIMAKARVALHL